MASLSTIVQSRLGTSGGAETNLEKGQIYYFTLQNYNNNTHGPCNQCNTWTAPTNGTAIVEIWGAGGSVGKMCCCGFAMPGNPGAYAKKTIVMSQNETICMNIGESCVNDGLCVKGISQPTCVCWITGGAQGNGTMCAGGGRGGEAFCVSGGSMFCCATACGYPGQNFATVAGGFSGGSSGCGIVCNYKAGEMATATGGDVNISPQFSCIALSHCNPCCQCHMYGTNAVPPGYVSECGGLVGYAMHCGHHYDRPSGTGMKQFIYALNGHNKAPSVGLPASHCWAAGRMCGCYECNTAATHMVPHGVGGPIATPCSSVRHHGWRGGAGAVRITFK